MNNKGNMMLNFLWFLMALAILIIFIGPIKAFIDIGQGNNFLNCPDFVDVFVGPSRNYTYNASRPSEQLSCLVIKLFLPFLLLVFIIVGVSKLIYDRGSDFIGAGQMSVLSGGYLKNP